MKSSDAKASKCHLKFSSQISIFSQAPIFMLGYFNFNGNENKLFIAIKVKLLNLHIREKCSF